ncbi:hypothetical protein KUTeg_000257 [Tegillarca granosa]|uniref:RDD domain-containing protein n=1 Tax=Tegillarca granosa TaxID=220873 RepID=A0ABQ9FX17_TEGGR|nr:hypothetical protein KUTeg_000257 [Tegillarca granosa]
MHNIYKIGCGIIECGVPMNNWLPYYCMYPPNQLINQGQSPISTNVQPQQSTRHQNNVNQRHRQPATVHTNLTGTEYQIPPLWKRVLAELLDFVVLFYLKVMLTIIVMRQLGYLKNDNILDVKLDLLPVLDITEITETLCLRKGPEGIVGGATPGKRVLGLKVVSCEEIVDLRNGKLLVIPAHNIGFLSALVRSVIKNFTMAFFFPACFTVFFFQHNRAAYDVLAKTIVVQAPVIRQQQQQQ